MRDCGRTTAIKMDPRNLDIIAATHTFIDIKEPYMLLSGYRSPATNAMLRSKSKGVAKNSLHMSGMAADLRLKSRSVGQIAKRRRGVLCRRCRPLQPFELRPHGLRPGPHLGRLRPICRRFERLRHSSQPARVS